MRKCMFSLLSFPIVSRSRSEALKHDIVFKVVGDGVGGGLGSQACYQKISRRMWGRGSGILVVSIVMPDLRVVVRLHFSVFSMFFLRWRNFRRYDIYLCKMLMSVVVGGMLAQWWAVRVYWHQEPESFLHKILILIYISVLSCVKNRYLWWELM